jgi:hypothetical protein
MSEQPSTTQPAEIIDPSGEHRPANAPKPAAKRPSRATRAASKNAAKPASKPAAKNGKATVTKITAAKSAPKRDEGPTVNGMKIMIADALIKFVGDKFVSAATAKALGVPLDLLKAESGRTLSYSPGGAWHKSLTSPGTGRGQRHHL